MVERGPGAPRGQGKTPALRAMRHRPQWGASLPPHLQGFPATVRQRAKGIPLVADLLAAGVDVVGVVVIQLAVGRAEGDEIQQGQSGCAGPTRPQVSQALVPGDIDT